MLGGKLLEELAFVAIGLFAPYGPVVSVLWTSTGEHVEEASTEYHGDLLLGKLCVEQGLDQSWQFETGWHVEGRCDHAVPVATQGDVLRT